MQFLSYICRRNYKKVDMTKKELYAEWVRGQEKLPVFFEPWWLDAVCAGREWDVIIVESQEEVQRDNVQSTRVESILAAMPYMLCKKWLWRWIDMPKETQMNGLWLDGNRSFDVTELQYIREEVTRQLNELKLAYYYQQYPIGSPVSSMLTEKGFKIRERVTYRIEDVRDLDKVIDGFSKNKKRQLQKALSLHAEHDMTAEQFFQFHNHCIESRKKHLSYSREFLLVLEQKAHKNNRCAILSICNADHAVYAAALLVWDKQRMYYLVPCLDPDYNESGAGALLVLEAIKMARELGVAFDFEGSMISGVAKHYKQFGPTPATYYGVEKYYKWWFRFPMFFNWLRNRKYR